MKTTTEDKYIESLIRTLSLILSINFLIHYLITGAIAYEEDVFFESDVANKLPAHAPSATRAYKSYEINLKSINAKLSDLETEINDETENERLEYLLKLKSTFQNELKQIKPPIIVSGFLGNKTVYYCLIASFFLSVLLFVFFSREWTEISAWKILPVGFLIYAGWMHTGWFRNFLFYDEDRTIFSFVNVDIGKFSFWYQEIRVLILCFLMAAIWQCCRIKDEDVSKEISKSRTSNSSFIELNNFAYYLNIMFTQWQISSLLLLGAFLPWTFAYWRNIINYHDNRYIVSATFCHFYWFITWVIFTIPLIRTYRHWIQLSQSAINEALTRNDHTTYNITTSFIREINPVSNLKLTYTGAASIISFFFPFKDLFT